MMYNQDYIKTIIPHRDPMLLVTTIEDLKPGEYVKTTFFVDPKREIFNGHFPEEPILPGVYTVECMAQAADIMLLSTERYKGKCPLFLGINNVKFLRKILPGETIAISAKTQSERIDKAIVKCEAEAKVGNEVAATGEVILAMR